MTIRSVLVVDDDALSREYLAEALRSLGLRAIAADGPKAALARAAEKSFDLVVTDLRMPETDGLGLIRALAKEHPGLPVVLVTAHGSLDAAVDALRLGAVDFLQKPVEPEALRLAIERVDRTLKLVRENDYLRSTVEADEPQLVARSPRLRATLESAARVATSKGTVLITGESGTGKERLAHFVHRNSPRANGPFIRVNCAALSEQLLESELFGHERGAFTGAVKRREGRFELADGGTLLLDEIGEISPALQSKLLRVLEEEEFERVGGTETLAVDVRVIATTNRELTGEVAKGRFREDLYYRLHVLPLHVAALRDRPEDVLPLAEHFARHYARQNGRPAPRITDTAVERLLAWHWPGNVRELENVVQRAVVLMPGEDLGSELLLFGPAGPDRDGVESQLEAAPGLANRRLEDLEREAILATVEAAGGNKTEAARRLGVTARTLSNKYRTWRERGLVA